MIFTNIKNGVLHSKLWQALDNPVLFYAARVLLVGRQSQTKRMLRRHLAATIEEKVLDVCCGIGEFAGVVDGQYYGVDLNPKFIEEARKRYQGRPEKSFEVGDVLRFKYPDNHFHKAMVVNSLHHFSDEKVLDLLIELRRVTKDVVIIVDADGNPRGLTRRALVAIDRGRFMRPQESLSGLISQVFHVETAVRFNVGLYTELLFCCRRVLNEKSLRREYTTMVPDAGE